MGKMDGRMAAVERDIGSMRKIAIGVVIAVVLTLLAQVFTMFDTPSRTGGIQAAPVEANQPR